jgi:Tfp pilus assembly PilM family ATPase
VRLKGLDKRLPERPLPSLREPDLRRVKIGETLKAKLPEMSFENASLVARARDTKAHLAWLPSTETAELDQMAQFEAEKIAPVEAEQLIADYLVLEQEDERSYCLLGTVDTQAMECTMRALVHSGLQLENATLSGWALYRAWKHAIDSGALDKSISEGEEILVYFGVDSIDIVLLVNGVPAMMRSSVNGLSKMLVNLRRGQFHLALDDLEKIDLNQTDFSLMSIEDEYHREKKHKTDELYSSEALLDEGSATSQPPSQAEDADDQEIQKAISQATSVFSADSQDVSVWGGGAGEIVRTWLNRNIQELKRTIAYAQSEHPLTDLGQITICGPGAVLKNLPEALEKNLDAPVRVLDGLCGVELDEKLTKESPDAMKELASKARRGLYIEPIGAALLQLDDEQKNFDLRPQWYLNKRAAGEKRRSLTTTAVLVIICLGLSIVYLKIRQDFTQDLIAAIERENNRLQPHAEKVIDMREKLELVSKHVDDQFSALAVMNLISELAPVKNKRVRLTSINFERGGDVIIRGDAKTVPDFNDFQFGLESSGFFTKVNPRDINVRPLHRGRPDVQSFDIQAPLKSQIPGNRRSGSSGSGIARSNSRFTSPGGGRP